MRHRRKTHKLGRTKSHRRATLQNLANQMIVHKQVRTTLAKAKASKSYLERLVTYGKKNTVPARRLVFKFLQNHQMVKQLFDDIAPTYSERNGGYTRIVKLGKRQGDGAEMAMLQFVGFEPLIIDEKKKDTGKKSKKKAPAKKKAEEKTEQAATAPAETVATAETEEVVEETKEPEEKTETKTEKKPEKKAKKEKKEKSKSKKTAKKEEKSEAKEVESKETESTEAEEKKAPKKSETSQKSEDKKDEAGEEEKEK